MERPDDQRDLDAADRADLYLDERADRLREGHRRVCEANAGPLFQERDPDEARDRWINDGMGRRPGWRR